MSTFQTIVAGIALVAASGATAVPQEAFWVEVPVVDDPSDTADLTGFRSFDLMIQLEEHDTVFVHALSEPANGAGLSLGQGQVFFNHSLGEDKAVSPALVGLFPDLEYDSRGQVGILAWDEYITLSLPNDWDPAGISTAIWQPNAPDSEVVDSSGLFWAARITVSSVGAFGEHTAGLGEYLGGTIVLGGEGPNGSFGLENVASGRLPIPNAFIPSPSSAALICIAAPVLLSRSRR